MRTLVVSLLFGIACTGPDLGDDPEVTVSATPGGTATEPAASATLAGPMRQILLRDQLADGREIMLAVAAGEDVQHAFLGIGDATQSVSGLGDKLRIEGVFAGDAFGPATIEVVLPDDTRAIFLLSAQRHDTPGGVRVFLEGAGTVGEQDVEVVGVALQAAVADETMLAVAAPSALGAGDGWAFVRVGEAAQVVLAEGVVGGELAPVVHGLAVSAAAEFAAVPGLRRERVRVTLGAADSPDQPMHQLSGVHQFAVECAQ